MPGEQSDARLFRHPFSLRTFVILATLVCVNVGSWELTKRCGVGGELAASDDDVDLNVRTDLANIHKRLEELFAKEKIEPELLHDDDVLTISFQTRTFKVFEEVPNSEFGYKLTEVIGPNGDGFWLQVRVVDKPSGKRYYKYESGWECRRNTHVLSESGKFASV